MCVLCYCVMLLILRIYDWMELEELRKWLLKPILNRTRTVDLEANAFKNKKNIFNRFWNFLIRRYNSYSACVCCFCVIVFVCIIWVWSTWFVQIYLKHPKDKSVQCWTYTVAEASYTSDHSLWNALLICVWLIWNIRAYRWITNARHGC